MLHNGVIGFYSETPGEGYETTNNDFIKKTMNYVPPVLVFLMRKRSQKSGDCDFRSPVP